jgi:hypothetical protein
MDGIALGETVLVQYGKLASSGPTTQLGVYQRPETKKTWLAPFLRGAQAKAF